MKIRTLRNWLAILTVLSVQLSMSACSAPRDSTADNDPPKEVQDTDESHDEHETSRFELSPEKAAALEITTSVAEHRTFAAVLETTGLVDFEQDRLAHVSPRIPGRVQSVTADLGQRVQEGQVLALLDSIELGRAKAEYLQSQAREELARENFERERGLYADRISSEREMLAAKAAHLEAVAALRNAEETLHLYGLSEEELGAVNYEDPRRSLFPLRAPLGGKIIEKHVTVGELVTPERNLFTIGDLSHLWIWIDVYERDLHRVHPEDDVVVRLDAFPTRQFEGRVSYLSDQVDVDSRTVRARVDIANPQGLLRPGMFARVALTDPHEASDGGAPLVAIPQDALQRDGSETIVFVVVGDRQFERREVQIGRRGGGFVEVLEGIEDGEHVVVVGAFLLKSEASKETMGQGHSH